MRKSRNYKAEYRRRLERGLSRGLSRAQARGHVPSAASAKTAAALVGSPLWSAYRTFQNSKNLSAAARAHAVSPERLRHLIKSEGLASRNGRTWKDTDDKTRRVLIYTRGGERQVWVKGYADAARTGAYWHVADQFVRTNDIEILTPFVGQGVTDSSGRFHPFETDPNAIHRLKAAGGPAFHEVYRLTL